MQDQHDQNVKPPQYDLLLDAIRERPAMCIGEDSLTALWFFLRGAAFTRDFYGIDRESEIPRHFADWAAYRLHLDSNCGGFWAKAILSRVRDEKLALDRFFQLRDEMAQREARTVATIQSECREFTANRMKSGGEIVTVPGILPKSLRIVVFTDDPGFFLQVDEPDRWFYDGWFFAALAMLPGELRPAVEKFEVQDHATWDRLIAEDVRYRRNLARRRARLRGTPQ